MTGRTVNQQPDLFETDDPPLVLSIEQRKQVLPLLEAMLIEITAMPVNEEVGDDEDQP